MYSKAKLRLIVKCMTSTLLLFLTGHTMLNNGLINDIRIVVAFWILFIIDIVSLLSCIICDIVKKQEDEQKSPVHIIVCAITFGNFICCLFIYLWNYSITMGGFHSN